MPAFYRASVASFLEDSCERILGRLTAQASAAGFYEQKHSQTDAWQQQVPILQSVLAQLPRELRWDQWHILLEYPIPRRAKRIDAILLTRSLIFVLEFKFGTSRFAADSIVQVEDYCLDLRDFHKESRGHLIVPILVLPKGRLAAVTSQSTEILDFVAQTQLANAATLPAAIKTCSLLCDPGAAIDAHAWDCSEYSPTPTIIDAARALYAGHNVRKSHGVTRAPKT